MCNACVIEAVKGKMLASSQRRGDVKRRPSPVSRPAPQRNAPQQPRRIIDLTHELHGGFPTYSGEQTFEARRQSLFRDYGFNQFYLEYEEHTGTHMDAPLHCSEDGLSIAELAVEELVAPLCIIDIADRAAANADTELTPDDIQTWIAAHGEIPEGACVAMNAGWSARVNGVTFRNADEKGVMHFPGVHVEAADMLLETGAASLAVDSLSFDRGAAPSFATHMAWLGAGRFGIECIANLHQVPAAGAMIFIGAPKHRGGTGGPARILAMV
jgi:kynurenine formamidase